jgi:WD40 repeat protein
VSPGPIGPLRSASAEDAAAETVHDAFISYSRADRDFAAALEVRLERYRPPRDLGRPYRYLEIFRDEHDFTGTDYTIAVERHLLASRKLIVVCSPAARASGYVAQEIRLFAAAKGAEHLIPLLLHGIPNNERTEGSDAELAFPDALCDVMSMPLAATFRGWAAGHAVHRGQFEGAWLTLLSNLFDVPRSDLEQRERRRQLAARRRWTSAIVAILLALTALTVWALVSRDEAVRQREAAERATKAEMAAKEDALRAAEEERKAKDLAEERRQEAERQRRIAITRQLAAQAELTLNQQPARLTDSVLLAVESLHPARQVASLEGYQALRHALGLLPPRPVILPHKGPVLGSSLSVDGTHLATLSREMRSQIVTLWSVNGRTLTLVRRFEPAATPPITALALSPGGRHLAILRAPGVEIWETRVSTRPVMLAPGIRAPARAQFSPDGRYLAVIGYAGTMYRLWTVDGWQALRPDVSGGFMALAFAPGGTLVTAGRDVMQEWAVPEAKPLRRCGMASASMAALSPDATAAAIVADGGTVRAVRFGGLKDPATCSEIARIRHQEGVTDLAISSGGGHVAIASQDGTARLWATADTREMARMTHANAVTTVLFDHGGRRLFTGGRDGAFFAWDVIDSAATRSFPHGTDVRTAAFVPDSGAVATITANGAVRLWSLAAARGLREPPHALHAAFVQLDDLRGGFDPVPEVVALASSPSGRYASLLTTDSTLLTWDLVARKELPEIDVDHEGVDTIAVSDSGQIAVLRPETGVQLLVPEEGAREPQRTLRDNVTAMEFVGAKGPLATVTGGGGVSLWDPSTGRRVARFEHGYPIQALVVSANGRYLATSGNDDVVLVWDSRTGGRVAQLPLDHVNILSAISPDGAYVAAIRGSVASVWDVRSGVETARLVHAGVISRVVFNRDGRLIATSSADFTARVWRWRPDDLVNEACARLTRTALSQDDWKRFLGEEPFRQSCPAPFGTRNRPADR